MHNPQTTDISMEPLQEVLDIAMQVESSFQSSPRPISVDYNTDNSVQYESSPLMIMAIRYPQEIEEGLRYIALNNPLKNFTIDQGRKCDVQLIFEKNNEFPKGKLSVSTEISALNVVTIRFNRTIDAFRALGRVMAASFDRDSSINFTEVAQFDSMG
jgi:hypothetical protein